MTVEQADVVDLASVSKSIGEVVLTISDHLDWSDTVTHQTILQKKFNAYLAFVESGEIVQKYPDAIGRPVAIRLVLKHRPDDEGRLFLQRAQGVIESAGISFRHELFAESYGS